MTVGAAMDATHRFTDAQAHCFAGFMAGFAPGHVAAFLRSPAYRAEW